MTRVVDVSNRVNTVDPPVSEMTPLCPNRIADGKTR